MKKHFLFLFIWGILSVNVSAQTDLWGSEGAWPMFQCDSRHTGRSNFVGPQTPNLLWSKKIADEICPQTSPIVGYNQLYVSAVNGIYALNFTGDVQWIFPRKNITSSAALGHYVYFGATDSLYALDYNGKLRWSFRADGDGSVNSPIIAGYPPKVFFASERKLYCFDPSNGYPIFIADIAGSVVVGPAATQDLAPSVYIPTLSQTWPTPWYDFRLFSFNNSGNQNWKFETLRFEGGVNSIPTIADDGTVYVTTIWSPGWTSRIYAISPAGEEKWTYGAYHEQFFYSSPAIGKDGTIYIGNSDGLLALNPNGTLNWEYPIGPIKYSSPAIGADGTIYVGTEAGKFCAINSNGTLKWESDTGNSPLGSPAIDILGTVYVASESGVLYAFTGPAVPVELSSFTASVKGNNIVLHWTTVTETNNLGFEIERSQDKVNFTKIGFVAGAGTCIIPHSYLFADFNLPAGTHYYRLKQIDSDGTFEYSDITEAVVVAPASFYLSQNYPNPFNPTTGIVFSLLSPSEVQLIIYNSLGQEVARLADGYFTAGKHSVQWDGDMPGGVYFYRMVADNFTAIKKMLLLK